MGQLSKREASICYLQQNEHIFACPICSDNIKINDAGKMFCVNNHSFDIAKQGYVNLMTKPVASMYSKELFESRQQIITSGLYDEVQREIALLLRGQQQIILDTGCGEGSHLVRICEQLSSSVGVGIDLSKEGIIAAAKHYANKIWCVGDLANSPFQPGSFTTILNFLSPANYDEFKRLLVQGGKVIKVVPQSNYLQQLRLQAFANSDKETYSNAQTVQRFKESFSKVDIIRVTYTKPIEKNLVPKLLEMTPMGWHIKSHDSIHITDITIDVDILVGEC